MKKISTFLGLFIFLSFAINAQYAFKVLAAKGANQVLANGAWATIKAGAKINSDQKLKVVNGGYLGLIHSSGKTFEIEESGEFSITSLELQVIKGKAGFGEKYANFVADGMFANNNSAGNNYDRTGSVTRGDGDKTHIIIYAPKIINALKSKPVTLEWNDCGKGHTYYVSLKNLFNEEVYGDTALTNSFTIDFSVANFPKTTGGNYLVEIVSLKDKRYTTTDRTADQDSEGGFKYNIHLFDDTQALSIEQSINPMIKTMDQTSAVDHLVLAMAYEKHNLMVYAVESYSKAQNLAPEVDAYKSQYTEYIKYKLNYNNLNGKPVAR